jgi:ABC-type sugar transport system substrate-binding protein
LWCGCFTAIVCGADPANDADAADPNPEYSLVLFTGSEEDIPFWVLFADFMREASQDLGMELEVRYAGGSRLRMQNQIREVCERAKKPDAIVVHTFKLNGLKTLQLASQYDVPIFLVNAGLTANQKAQVGEPRTKLKNWIGEMLPDDEGAGYQLANALIDEARKDPTRLAPDGRVHLIGLNGVVSDGASIQRLAGLNRAVAERSDEAVLDQAIAAQWQQSVARRRCRFLHRRYPDSSVIWTASDLMALGAMEAMQDRGLEPGKQIIIGGVDASAEAMEQIEQGTLFASVGGHFMEGGWVAVMLFDYFHSLDLSRIPTHYASPMTLVTRSNLAAYRSALSKSTWQRFDFRQLSLHLHPERQQYHFDPKVITSIGLSEGESLGSSVQDVPTANQNGGKP